MVAQRLIAAFLSLLLAGIVSAGQVDVLKVAIEPTGTPGQFDIAVTLRHTDTGWDHYADRWDVIGPDGKVLASRRLLHPHIHEQPFTRSLGGVRIPAEFTWVRVRGHDLVHGTGGGREVTLSVPHP